MAFHTLRVSLWNTLGDGLSPNGGVRPDVRFSSTPKYCATIWVLITCLQVFLQNIANPMIPSYSIV